MEEKEPVAAEGAKPFADRPAGRRKKLGVLAGVLVAVLVVAGAGLWVWHEQPSFCGAVCHTPMDPYLSTYEQEPDSQGVDKWGNDVQSTNAMLSVTHRVQGESCLSCHVPTLSEQVAEGASWITGSYEVKDNATYGVVLTEKSLSDLTAASGVDDESFCLNETCHVNDDGSVMTRDDLVERTAHYELNPHADKHANTTCSDCHKAHRASVLSCTQCHAEAEVPDGWLSVSESRKLAAA